MSHQIVPAAAIIHDDPVPYFRNTNHPSTIVAYYQQHFPRETASPANLKVRVKLLVGSSAFNRHGVLDITEISPTGNFGYPTPLRGVRFLEALIDYPAALEATRRWRFELFSWGVKTIDIVAEGTESWRYSSNLHDIQLHSEHNQERHADRCRCIDCLVWANRKPNLCEFLNCPGVKEYQQKMRVDSGVWHPPHLVTAEAKATRMHRTGQESPPTSAAASSARWEPDQYFPSSTSPSQIIAACKAAHPLETADPSQLKVKIQLIIGRGWSAAGSLRVAAPVRSSDHGITETIIGGYQNLEPYIDYPAALDAAREWEFAFREWGVKIIRVVAESSVLQRLPSPFYKILEDATYEERVHPSQCDFWNCSGRPNLCDLLRCDKSE